MTGSNMPISTINQDGTVNFYNKKTGKVYTNVPASQLGDYSPNLVAEYQQMQTPENTATRLEAEQKVKKLQDPNQTGMTAEQGFRVEAASKAVERLEQLFGRGEASNIGTGSDLSLAQSATVLGKAGAKASAVGKSLFDSKYQEDINIFRAALENAKGIFTQAFGSGTPQAFEATELLRNAPGPESTDREALEWFNTVKAFLGKSQSVTQEQQVAGAAAEPPTFETIEPSAMGAVDQVQKKNENTPEMGVPLEETARNIALKAGEAAPIALGTAGSVGGSILGSAGGPAGTLLGGAGGMAVGTLAGKAVENIIENIAGVQDESAAEQLDKATKQAAAAGITDLVLGSTFNIVGKAGGFVLKSLSKVIDDIPLKGIRFKPTQITEFAKKHGEKLAEWMVKNKILGENAVDLAAQKAAQLQDAFDNLALNKNIKIPITSFINRFRSELEELAPGIGKLVPSEYKGIALKITTEIDNIVNQLKSQRTTDMTAEMVTQLRRKVDDLIPQGAWVDQNVKNVAIRLRSMYNDVVQEAVDKTMLASGKETGEVGLKQLGQELSKYYDFLLYAEKQEGLGKGNQFANLPKILMGGFGFQAAGIPGAAVGLAGEQMLRDPAVLKAIYEAGKMGQKLTPAMEAVLKATGQGISTLGGAAIGQVVGQ